MSHRFIQIFAFLASLAMARAQFGGFVTSNGRGGMDGYIQAGRQFGTPQQNIAGGVFARGNTMGGDVTRGGFLSAKSNGLSASLQHAKTDNVGSVFSQNVRANILNTPRHNLDATAFHSRTNLDNGFNFNQVGGGLDYTHASGLGAAVTASRIPQLNMNTVDVIGKANLYTSPDKSTTVDLTGGVSKTMGGPMDGQVNKHIEVGLTQTF
ncbi:attacin-A [Stomoxys calcitrans]|uniref:attacin-A n=1 Tax=Stomoxys calcitrans TaxID=35570 RepID=UPI0027E27408|nr:attacin-A [Stomoxys calcitrans]XP_059220102.1 attacin-A [Stomoxys calcitrans]XP_059220103.1 attacin-A [Stomoxys calcitrans]XP_059220104.1 attacin-A [Stomoxys calcitrans]XP_059220105.1 attacin-A [Stomoxys calcitrans]